MTTLQENSPAPRFSAKDSAGNTVTLEQFRGRTVILYFYPKDFTPGCTLQACAFRDAHSEFTEKNAVILGVSPDKEARHAEFASKYSLPFQLLADPDHQLAELFGVWKQKSFMGRKFLGVERSTFVIDPEGKIRSIHRGVKVLGHVKKMLAEI